MAKSGPPKAVSAPSRQAAISTPSKQPATHRFLFHFLLAITPAARWGGAAIDGFFSFPALSAGICEEFVILGNVYSLPDDATAPQHHSAVAG
ncbi:hypothetical protein Dda_1510 [Drechslerella dactyloides]|uniref:Uncharacterized protein n=1 Tax=Drechslerella dactyloides TaxID=74499 RepID=A0AAD6J366_DREDA|nr:hypothetical protein Dda_1510 [Drechslerella dactyloides]